MKWVMAVLALAITTPLSARDIAVPADKGWKHAATGVILMPQLAGMSRTALTDATQSEHDVTVQLDTPDKSVFATIYIFHPAIADVGMWFDRSRTTLESRDTFRSAAPTTANPVSFAAPGAGPASSLRQLYSIAGGPYRSTALAVVPAGEWIVTIRMSAATLTADQLDARLQQVIGAIRWPVATGPAAPVATPIAACAQSLAFTKAKLVKPDGADILVSLLGGAVAARQKADGANTPVVRERWCREGEASNDYGVYRSAGGTNGYVMALYDAGRVVSVFPSIMGQIDNSGTYSVTLADVDATTSAFPSFSALPAPKQVWKLVSAGKRSGVAKGNNVTLDAKAWQ